MEFISRDYGGILQPSYNRQHDYVNMRLICQHATYLQWHEHIMSTCDWTYNGMNIFMSTRDWNYNGMNIFMSSCDWTYNCMNIFMSTCNILIMAWTYLCQHATYSQWHEHIYVNMHINNIMLHDKYVACRHNFVACWHK